MNAPIIGREGLLSLVELVDRLRARAMDEGDTPWTAEETTNSPEAGEPGDAVGSAAGGEPSGRAEQAECAHRPAGDGERERGGCSGRAGGR